MDVRVGDTIRIIVMDGEPQYTNKVGVVRLIDDAGQIHGSWGSCALIKELDRFEVVSQVEESFYLGKEDL